MIKSYLLNRINEPRQTPKKSVGVNLCFLRIKFSRQRTVEDACPYNSICKHPYEKQALPLLFSIRLFFHDGRAEGQKRELCHLEALESEGNADDSDAESRACDEVTDGKLQSTEEEPDDIDDDGSCFFAVNDLLAEGCERKTRHFNALNADGNTDERYTPENAGDEPCQSEPKTAKDDPKKVTDKFHTYQPFTKD